MVVSSAFMAVRELEGARGLWASAPLSTAWVHAIAAGASLHLEGLALRVRVKGLARLLVSSASRIRSSTGGLLGRHRGLDRGSLWASMKSHRPQRFELRVPERRECGSCGSAQLQLSQVSILDGGGDRRRTTSTIVAQLHLYPSGKGWRYRLCSRVSSV